MQRDAFTDFFQSLRLTCSTGRCLCGHARGEGKAWVLQPSNRFVLQVAVRDTRVFPSQFDGQEGHTADTYEPAKLPVIL